MQEDWMELIVPLYLWSGIVSHSGMIPGFVPHQGNPSVAHREKSCSPLSISVQPPDSQYALGGGEPFLPSPSPALQQDEETEVPRAAISCTRLVLFLLLGPLRRIGTHSPNA
jgi:hypothetical protein